ncbi:MAG: hypothetical protein LUD69_04430 [Oscillospiraceae bacterium]|nr:hypothetical protein [Oscillospiraceae bacterium]
MTFTFNEWGFIKHSMGVAAREYEKIMQDCTPSDKELSNYQIFKRQMEQANAIVKKIENAEI